MNREKAVRCLKAITLVGIYGGLLMPLVFIPIVIFPFVFSKLIFFQILIGLTFPAYLVLAWMEPKYRPRFHLLYVAIAAYFVALLLSVIFAIDPLRAWWGNQERMNGLFTLLHFLAWLTMAVGIIKTWEQWRKLLNYEVVLSVFMAVVALLQRVYPRLLLFPASDRVGGLLDNPIYMGTYQIFNLFFLALLLLKTKSRKLWAWYAIAAVVDLGAFVAAQSRGDLVGFAAGIICFAVFFALFSKNKKARYGILGVVGGLFIAYGLLFAFRHTAFVSQSVFGRFTNFSVTVGTRFIAWKIAWHGFLERPLTGWGLDDFHILFNLKYNPQSLRFSSYETWFDRSHNTIFDVLSMTGILGFLTFAGIWLSLFYSVWRAFKKKWIDLPMAAVLTGLPVGYFVQNLFVFDHPAAFSMSYLLFALVIAATGGSFITSADAGGGPAFAKATAGKQHNFAWWLLALLQLGFFLLVWRASILPFQASRLAIKGNNNFASSAGLDYVKRAAAIWTPYLDEQSFLLSRNIVAYGSRYGMDKVPQWQERYQLAKQLSEEEIRRHPLNTNPHLTYAQLATMVGTVMPSELKVAEDQYLAAIATSPKRQQIYFSLAQLYLQEGRSDQALALFKQARDFDPELGEGYWRYGLIVFYDKKDYAAGAEQIIKSQTAAYPYALQAGREVQPLADAYFVAGDKSGMTKLADRITNLPQASGLIYAQIAARCQFMGLPEAKDKILNFAKTIDASADQEYKDELQRLTAASAVKPKAGGKAK